MEQRRWLNTTQPQTLQIAVLLLYLTAVLSLVSGVLGSAIGPIGLVLAVAPAAGGYGVANERKWGYIVALVAAFVPFAFLALAVATVGIGGVLSTGLISLMFEIALVALLLHPQSREYQRIWFK
ncbi:MAG: hypothetical protein ACYDH5_11365 [Acidimicrobiales bacterium]